MWPADDLHARRGLLAAAAGLVVALLVAVAQGLPSAEAAPDCDDVAAASTRAQSGAAACADRPARGVAVAADRRTLSREGAPFFWLADTALGLAANLNRSEIERYLDKRVEQGFTVVQTAAVFASPDGPVPDQYGDTPLGAGLEPLVTDGATGDEEQDYDYWDHLDFVVAQAAQRGLVVALLPLHADPPIAGDARAYGEFLGRRYAGATNVVWVLGPDTTDGLAEGIGAGGGRQLAAPRDLRLLLDGSCVGEDKRRDLVAAGYAARAPFVDAAAIAGARPYCRSAASALDVRRDAYWSVLGGAAGHTFGATVAADPASAGQMGHLRTLVEARPRLEPSGGLVADAGAGRSRIQAAVAADRSVLVAYTAAGLPVDVDLGALRGSTARAWWFDPRIGEVTGIAEVESSGRRAFTPPAAAGDQQDWVLVIDDADAGFEPPGPLAPRKPPEAPAKPAPAAPPKPARQQAPKPAPEQVPRVPSGSVWDRLAHCESSGDWRIDTGNGYHGGLQFDDATWRDYRGTEFAAKAHLATRDQQITVAMRVRDDRGGYGSWPSCAEKLGLPR